MLMTMVPVMNLKPLSPKPLNVGLVKEPERTPPYALAVDVSWQATDRTALRNEPTSGKGLKSQRLPMQSVDQTSNSGSCN